MTIGYHPDLDEYNESLVRDLTNENLRYRRVIRDAYKEICNSTIYYENRAEKLRGTGDGFTDLESIELRGVGLGFRRAELVLLRALLDNGFDDINLIR